MANPKRKTPAGKAGAARDLLGGVSHNFNSCYANQPQGQSFRYPHHPGAKGSDGTSQEAAEAIAPCAKRLRRIAMHCLSKLGSATVLEAVAVSGVEREALQPRFSELRLAGLVEPTGDRRRNPSGKWAAVLRLTNAGRAAL
jgi:hypothetical protein